MSIFINILNTQLSCYNKYVKNTVIKSGSRIVKVTVVKNMDWYNNNSLLHDNHVPDVSRFSTKMEHIGL